MISDMNMYTIPFTNINRVLNKVNKMKKMKKSSQLMLVLFLSSVTLAFITRAQEKNDPNFVLADRLPLSCTITLISNAIIFTVFLFKRLYDLFTKEFNYHEVELDEKEQLMEGETGAHKEVPPVSPMQSIKNKIERTIINQDVKSIVMNNNKDRVDDPSTHQLHSIPNWGVMLCYSLGTATCLACYAVCQFNIISTAFLCIGFLIISLRESFMRRFAPPELTSESTRNRRSIQNIRFWFEMLLSALILCILACIIAHAVKLNWANITEDRKIQEIGGYVFYAVIPSVVWFAPLHIAVESLVELSVPISITWSVLVILSKKDNYDVYSTMDFKKNRLWLYVTASSCLYPAVLYSLFSLTKKGVCLDITAIFTMATLVSYFFFSVPDESGKNLLNAVISMSCFAVVFYAYLEFWKRRNIVSHEIYKHRRKCSRVEKRIPDIEAEIPESDFSIEDNSDTHRH